MAVRKALQPLERNPGGTHSDFMAANPLMIALLAQVSQEELEVHDKVTQGKYTVGLGQHCMAFCGDQEDVVSMSLTAVHSLLEKYDVDPKSIGRHVYLCTL